MSLQPAQSGHNASLLAAEVQIVWAVATPAAGRAGSHYEEGVFSHPPCPTRSRFLNPALSRPAQLLVDKEDTLLLSHHDNNNNTRQFAIFCHLIALPLSLDSVHFVGVGVSSCGAPLRKSRQQGCHRIHPPPPLVSLKATTNTDPLHARN